MGDLKGDVETRIRDTPVMVFSKTTCPFCARVKKLLKKAGIDATYFEIDKIDNGPEIQAVLKELTGQGTVPNVFVNGEHIGGCDDTLQAFSNGSLSQKVVEGQMRRDPIDPAHKYDYDLVVLGGGSGGLACAKEAAKNGARVACLDFVQPTPQGTTWGLGGTCVNVGCIPKKLMHHAALLGDSLEDARHYGWQAPEKVEHDWGKLVGGVQDHIGSLNWGYRVQLRDKNVKYINAFGEFVDPHTIKHVNRRGKEDIITAARVVVAVGGRPRYPDIPGAKDYGITSDDLFSMTTPPGKTLCVGASYVSLECAGFLAKLGFDVTVMVRSILLRGFDQQMSEIVGDYMKGHGVNFLRGFVPTKIELIEEGPPRKLRVTYQSSSGGEEKTEEYNSVLLAIGRDPTTKSLGLDKAGVETVGNGYIPAVYEQTNVPHIYAIGDVLEGKDELTPLAIQAGKLLAKRLFGDSKLNTEYMYVPTTVFTPLEYGACGLPEEDARAIYGDGNIDVYHAFFQPLEWTVPQRENNACYCKLVINKLDNERIIGLHVTGPSAGEMTQGYAVAIRMRATKDDFDATIGIHPTVSENFTTLEKTKSSGEDPQNTDNSMAAVPDHYRWSFCPEDTLEFTGELIQSNPVCYPRSV